MEASMLLTGYIKEIFRPECNPSFESVHCIARLNENIGAVLPYLNAVLGGTQYFADPPEVMFHHHGKIIKVGSREIAEAQFLDSFRRIWFNTTSIFSPQRTLFNG
ncbi:MAG: hypothetical protein JRI76_12845 [Deltaproteobacteria bacterium]|nr:hypothetical protein [Deltaproteobacteria bacterium]MBW2133478.1 hypothetical protein [Deltaproteobacteria bacterium]